MPWLGEVLKVAVFQPDDGNPPAALDVWKEMVGGDPDNFHRPRGPVPGVSIASGRWKDFNLTFVSQPARLDLQVQQFDVDADKPTPPPLMDQLDEGIAAARQLGLALLKLSKTVRIGAIMQLVQDIPDRAAASLDLNKELGVQIFGPNATDHLIQMNVRSKYDALALDINRLCRWGTASLQSTLVQLDAKGKQQPSAQQSHPRDVMFLHIDVNNVALVQPVDATKTTALFNHLWDEAIRIKNNGRRALN